MNKYRVTFLFIVLLLQTFYSFGQTKEETISWLESKLKEYFVGQRIVTEIKISPCSIISTINIYSKTHYNYDRSIINAKSETYRRYVIPTTSVMSVIKSDTLKNVIHIKFDAAVVECTEWEEVYYGSYTSEVRNYRVNHINIVDGESNLAERIIKAIEHLSTFCDKPKETF